MIRWILLGSLLVVMACSSSDTTAATTADKPASTTDAGTSCGVAFSFATDQAACEGWNDQNCCAEEQACAADAACAGNVACINACPSPRTAACIAACGNTVAAALDALASCTKNAPSPPAGAKCDWP